MIVNNLVNAHCNGNEVLLFGYHRMNLGTKIGRSKMDKSYCFGKIILLKKRPLAFYNLTSEFLILQYHTNSVFPSYHNFHINDVKLGAFVLETTSYSHHRKISYKNVADLMGAITFSFALAKRFLHL